MSIDPLDKELETIVKPGMYGEEREQALSALKQIIGKARKDELLKIKAIKSLPMITEREFLEDISRHIEKRIKQLESEVRDE